MLLIHEDQGDNSSDYTGRYRNPVTDSKTGHNAAAYIEISAEELQVVKARMGDDRGPEVSRAQVNCTEDHSDADSIK